MPGYEYIIYLCIIWCVSPTIVVPSSSIDPVTTLECHRRQYSYKVQQTDSDGRTCWDHINVMSCWGRCDSNEIADWKFPYKKSHHPVCLHSSTQEKKVTLRNCDEGVDSETKIYTFQEAASCSCSFCRSSEASCEGLRYRGARRAPRQTKKSFPSKYSLRNLSPSLLKYQDVPHRPSLFPRLLKNDQIPQGVKLIEVVDPSNDLNQMIDQMNEIDRNIISSILKDRKIQKKRDFPSVGQIPFVDASSNDNLDFLSFLDATFGVEKEDSSQERKKISIRNDRMNGRSNDMFGIK